MTFICVLAPPPPSPQFEYKDGMLAFKIKNVDRTFPDAELSFLVHIDENAKYHIYNCSPRLPTLDTLVR